MSDAKQIFGKYLTFILGHEEYGIEILKVQEIIGMMEVTAVPKAPPFIRGIINLRGNVIPVVDLREKFEMPRKENSEKTCVIVLNVNAGDAAKTVTMGILVDEVSEVLDIASEKIDPPPDFGAAVDTRFILGIGKLEKKVAILLDIDKVLKPAEISALAVAAPAA